MQGSAAYTLTSNDYWDIEPVGEMASNKLLAYSFHFVVQHLTKYSAPRQLRQAHI